MDSITEQIKTRLQKGETPQDLIKSGFKRTTVYAVYRKMQDNAEESNDAKSMEQSMDRLTFLASIIKEAMGQILSEVSRNHDCATELPMWKSIIKIASDDYEKFTGKKPPTDFLIPTLQ